MRDCDRHIAKNGSKVGGKIGCHYLASASKLPLNANLVRMAPIVGRLIGDVNPLFSQSARKDTCRSVYGEHHLGIAYPCAEFFNRLEFKEPVLGLADGKHRAI